MQQIINFIIRNKTFLLYVLLFSLSVLFTIQNHSFHRSKFVNSANFLSGGIYQIVNNINKYFDLNYQNAILQEENNKLKTIVFNTNATSDSLAVEYHSYATNYNLIPAILIKNNYSFSNNILLINRGNRDSIKEDFGVITSKGILGIIDHTSNKYATVLSILNTKSRISAQLKATNHFGTLRWDGRSHDMVQLVDIPSKAMIREGDTIMTSGRSAIFPKGIPIGTIASYQLDAAEDFYELNISLFNDMTNIEHVYVIQNKDAQEIDQLLNTE